MKKILCAILIFVIICFELSACGTSSSDLSSLYAKVTYSDGSSETLDIKEIPDLRYENVVAFNQKYAGQEIEIVDKIAYISSYVTYDSIIIELQHGWSVCLKTDDPIVAELRNGDTVKIVGDLMTEDLMTYSVTIQNATVTMIIK